MRDNVQLGVGHSPVPFTPCICLPNAIDVYDSKCGQVCTLFLKLPIDIPETQSYTSMTDKLFGMGREAMGWCESIHGGVMGDPVAEMIDKPMAVVGYAEDQA